MAATVNSPITGHSNDLPISVAPKNESIPGLRDITMRALAESKPQSTDGPALVQTRSVGARRQRSSSLEKQDFHSIHQQVLPQVVTLSAPTGQFVINTLFQIASFAVAIAFGIYAAKSVTVANNSLQQAVIANQLAILAVCLSNENKVGHEQNFQFGEGFANFLAVL